MITAALVPAITSKPINELIADCFQRIGMVDQTGAKWAKLMLDEVAKLTKDKVELENALVHYAAKVRRLEYELMVARR